MNGRAFSLVALICVLAACNGASGDAAAALTRDSAGVQIAENPSSGAALPTWPLDPAPVVEVGSRENDPAHQLHQVRSAARLPDGRILIANAGTRELRLFDERGNHLRSVGSEGEGPGEFQDLAWAGPYRGDSIAAWDPNLNRLSVFDSGGQFVRAATAHELPGFFPQVLGALEDGSLIAAPGVGPPAAGGSAVWRDTVAYLRLGPDGTVLDTLARVAGSEWMAVPPRNGRGTFHVQTLPFGRRALLAVSGNRVHVGTGDRFEVAAYGPDGTLRGLIRRDQSPLRVTDADVAEYRRGQLAGGRTAARDRQAMEHILDAAPYPETMPAYAALLADTEGNLWVQETKRPAQWDGETRWTVFDPSGRVAANVVAPPGLLVRAAGGDWVLGTFRDEDRVEHVRMYRLRRP